ncbi:hypothetical protein NDU88_002119 [Pleurodeles waltl]|uniref:Uncharacterized protein n=1 Tax=Pleurodeles waltl TaxID=8319 RepID=A0AAV7VYF6_PLEWA|nr:hypothetical protein NDU88_002119 [Pleurodeles waltl]
MPPHSALQAATVTAAARPRSGRLRHSLPLGPGGSARPPTPTTRGRAPLPPDQALPPSRSHTSSRMLRPATRSCQRPRLPGDARKRGGPGPQVTDSSAPFRANPGSEWHPTGPEEDRALENGNPDIRILIDLPVEEREIQHLEEKKKVVGAGNPDIRVPESVKREEGMCAAHTGEEKDAEEKDAEEGRTEIAGREDREGYKKNSDPHLGGTEPGNTRETPTEGQDSPEKLELRHVPGGMWLKQSMAIAHLNSMTLMRQTSLQTIPLLSTHQILTRRWILVTAPDRANEKSQNNQRALSRRSLGC